MRRLWVGLAVLVALVAILWVGAEFYYRCCSPPPGPTGALPKISHGLKPLNASSRRSYSLHIS